MKRVFVMVVCGFLAAILTFGCEARMEVAKERVKEKIDSLLGSMDVKRKGNRNLGQRTQGGDQQSAEGEDQGSGQQ